MSIFASHRLNPSGVEKVENVRTAFEALLARLETIVGPTGNRELALVRTKLQEAKFFAVEAVALQRDNQE